MGGVNTRLKRQLDKSEREKARLRERVRSLTKRMLAAGVMHQDMMPKIDPASTISGMVRRQTMMPSSPSRQSRGLGHRITTASDVRDRHYDRGLHQLSSNSAVRESPAERPPSTATVAAMARAAANRKLELRSKKQRADKPGAPTPRKLSSAQSPKLKSSTGRQSIADMHKPYVPWR